MVEAEEPEASTSTSTTSTTSSTSAKSSYPQVDKWESGITRGPANPIGLTKWSDVVGSKLTRGHANPLSEQTGMPGGNGGAYAAAYLNGDLDTKTTDYPTPWGDAITIPADSLIKLWDENDSRLEYYIDRANGQYTKDADGSYLMKNKKAPSELYMRQILPSGSLRNFTTKKDNINWFIVLRNEGKGWFPNQNYFKVDPTNPNKYLSFDPSDYITISFTTKAKNWVTDHWVDLAIIVAASITGGLAGVALEAAVGSVEAGAEAFNILGWQMTNRAFAAYLGEAGVWTGRAAWEAYDGKYGSAAIDMLFGLILPGLHGVGISKWGIKANDAVIESTAKKVLGKTPQELEALMSKPAAEGGLESAEKKLVQDVSNLPKESIENMTKELTTKANANIKAKGINLTKNKILSKASDLIQKSKVGAFLKKQWYTWIPTIFAHDMVFINLVDKIAQRFGIINKITIEQMAEMYKNNPGKAQKMIEMSLQNSNSADEFQKKVEAQFFTLKKNENAVIDPQTGKVNHTVSQAQRAVDSLNNVLNKQ